MIGWLLVLLGVALVLVLIAVTVRRQAVAREARRVQALGRLAEQLELSLAQLRPPEFRPIEPTAPEPGAVAPFVVAPCPSATGAREPLRQRTERRNVHRAAGSPRFGESEAECLRPCGRIGDERHAITRKERQQLAWIVAAVHCQHGIVALPRAVLHVHVADQDETHARACLPHEIRETLEAPRALVGADRAQHCDGRDAVVGHRQRHLLSGVEGPRVVVFGAFRAHCPRARGAMRNDIDRMVGIVLRQRRPGPSRGREQERRPREKRRVDGAPVDDVDVRERRLRGEAPRAERWVGLRAAIHAIDAEEEDGRAGKRGAAQTGQGGAGTPRTRRGRGRCS